MNNEMYAKLVDLYAGDELPEELQAALEAEAAGNPALAQDMSSLRQTIKAVKHHAPSVEFTEESFQRILMKMYARGVDAQTKSPTPAHIQYHLPMSG